MKRKIILLGVGVAVTAIVVLAGFLRTYDIANYPPGLFADHAANGEDALLILNGDTRPFYPRGNGREALFFYLQALLIYFFGIGVWPMFLASAIVGTLTVWAMYFATKVYFGRLAGLLAMLFTATSAWHITTSRTGFRAILMPLFIALFTAFVGYVVLRVKEKKITASYIYAVLAGVAYGLGFYSYIAYRSMIPVVIGIFVLLLLASLHPKIGLPHVKRYGKQAGIAIATAFIVLLPLLYYFFQHPEAIIGRAGQVSIFSPSLQQEVGGGTLIGTLGYTTSTTLLSFFTYGDENWRHNVAGYPLLNALVGVLFLLGCLFVLQGLWNVGSGMLRGKQIHMGMIYPYLVLLFVGMLAPVVTTAEGMPHALRSLGMLAPVYMIAGIAGAVSVRWLVERGKKRKIQGIIYGAIGGLLIVAGVYDVSLYFIISRNSPEAYIAYRGDLTVISKYIKEYVKSHPNSPKPILDIDPYFAQTVHYLNSVGASDYTDNSLDDKQMYVVADSTKGIPQLAQQGQYIIFTQSTMWDADQYKQRYGRNVKLITSQVNRFGQEIMRIYETVTPADSSSADLDA